ncbi:MAG TPA: hypothetical protein VEC11_03955 [Allosphingosinicella sp.]|nr:hypothetical protein [Allosphingosinicella sp.]
MTRITRLRPTMLALTAACGAAAAPAAPQAQPMPGAPDWQLSDRLEGVVGRTCMARSSGPDANMRLLLNESGVPVLIAARPDWRNESREAEVGLSIDGAAPARLQGFILANLVLVKIEDGALLQRLRGASAIEWTFPFGRFRVNIAGFGAALDALRACGASAPAGATPG